VVPPWYSSGLSFGGGAGRARAAKSFISAEITEIGLVSALRDDWRDQGRRASPRATPNIGIACVSSMPPSVQLTLALGNPAAARAASGP